MNKNDELSNEEQERLVSSSTTLPWVLGNEMTLW